MRDTALGLKSDKETVGDAAAMMLKPAMMLQPTECSESGNVFGDTPSTAVLVCI